MLHSPFGAAACVPFGAAACVDRSGGGGRCQAAVVSGQWCQWSVARTGVRGQGSGGRDRTTRGWVRRGRPAVWGFGEVRRPAPSAGRGFRRGRETCAERGRGFRRGQETCAERGRGCGPVTRPAPSGGDAKRPGLRPHAERGNEGLNEGLLGPERAGEGGGDLGDDAGAQGGDLGVAEG